MTFDEYLVREASRLGVSVSDRDFIWAAKLRFLALLDEAKALQAERRAAAERIDGREVIDVIHSNRLPHLSVRKNLRDRYEITGISWLGKRIAPFVVRSRLDVFNVTSVMRGTVWYYDQTGRRTLYQRIGAKMPRVRAV